MNETIKDIFLSAVVVCLGAIIYASVILICAFQSVVIVVKFFPSPPDWLIGIVAILGGIIGLTIFHGIMQFYTHDFGW